MESLISFESFGRFKFSMNGNILERGGPIMRGSVKSEGSGVGAGGPPNPCVPPIPSIIAWDICILEDCLNNEVSYSVRL